MSLIRKHGAVLQAWACLDLVIQTIRQKLQNKIRLPLPISMNYEYSGRLIFALCRSCTENPSDEA